MGDVIAPKIATQLATLAARSDPRASRLASSVAQAWFRVSHSQTTSSGS
jgi:hypothetical protein